MFFSSSSFMKCGGCKHRNTFCHKVARKHNSQQINCMSKCIKHRNGRNDSERESERVRWKKLSKYFHVVQQSLFYQSLEWDKYKATSTQSSSVAPYAHLKHEWAMNNQPVEKKNRKEKSQQRVNGMLSSHRSLLRFEMISKKRA